MDDDNKPEIKIRESNVEPIFDNCADVIYSFLNRLSVLGAVVDYAIIPSYDENHEVLRLDIAIKLKGFKEFVYMPFSLADTLTAVKQLKVGVYRSDAEMYDKAMKVIK